MKSCEQLPTDRNILYERYGHLIPHNIVEVPMEHRKRKKDPHSLRCFKMKLQKDENGNRMADKPRVRCKNEVVDGYLFCKFHGGKLNPLVKSSDAPPATLTTAQIYRNVYDANMANLLDAFLNDPQLLDLKPDLANLRLILNNYIKKILETPHPGTIRNFMDTVREILIEEEKSENWKFNKILELADSINTITNGRTIDRINRCVENIGKTIERIKKIENKDDFLLTPEGLKVFLRAMVDLMEAKISDKDLKESIREGLLTLSVQTSGDISQYRSRKEQVVDAEVIP